MTAAGAMIVDKLRYVHEDLDRHGNVRIYFWRGKGHPKTRIREAPGTPAFRRIYDDLLSASATTRPPAVQKDGRSRLPTPGTFRWLCVAYFGSAEFKALDLGTQKVRRGILEHCFLEPIAPGVTACFADMPLPRFTAKAVRILRDRKAAFPESANGRVKSIRAVYRWALEAEGDLVLANPARDVPYLRGKVGGFRAWTIEDVLQYEARHPIGTKARLALALFLYTSQRKSDVVLFGRQHIANGWLNFTQFKNRLAPRSRCRSPCIRSSRRSSTRRRPST